MLVTVYLPTRNRLEFLHKAVESVLAQSLADLELIVVNDGSTDGTASYLEQVQRRDRRIICLHNERSRGAPACRNQAIRLASSPFVTGLDDDDTFAPFRLEAFVAAWRLAERCGFSPAMLYAQDNWVVDGKLVYTTRKKGSVRHTDMDVQNQVGNQAFAPKHHFVEAGLFDEALPAWQDLEFFIRVLRSFGPASLVDIPSYHFDVSPRADRISAQQRRVTIASRIVRERHFPRNGRSAQLIALQVFGPYYGFRPSLSDFADFVSQGFWPLGLARLTVARLKRRSPEFRQAAVTPPPLAADGSAGQPAPPASKVAEPVN